MKNHSTYHAVFNLLRDENENVIAVFENSPQRGLDGQQNAARAAKCLNAPDPAKALEKARDALEAIYAILAAQPPPESGPWRWPQLAEIATEALALLTPSSNTPSP